MKYVLLTVFLVLMAFSAFADIGPSPNFSFSVSNADNFPDYEFFYAGNIWPDELEPVTDSTNIYKLNTIIKVYAVPVELVNSQEMNQGNFEDVSAQSIVSHEINLSAGHTSFQVSSFDAVSKSMQLTTVGSNPDPDTGSLNPLVIAGIAVVVFAAIIIVALKLKH